MANYIVTTTQDETTSNGTLSLREAITLANANSGHDTITFDASLTSGGVATIYLTQGTLNITEGVSITGSSSGGVPQIGLDGLGSAQIMSATVGAVETLTLEHLEFTGGVSTTTGGGALYADVQGTLNINNSVFSGNYAYGTFGSGGAIHIDGLGTGTVTLTGTTVSGNYAQDNGGGIYNGSADVHLTVTGGSLISMNRADGIEHSDGGGGIYTKGDFSLIGSDVINNVASVGKGGGILSTGGVGSMSSSSSVSNNYASVAGGGIALINTAFTVTDGYIGSNVAGTTSDGVIGTTAFPGNGGGVAAFGSSVFTVSSGYLTSNHADNDGGAVWVDNGASAALLTANVLGNSADGDGGAVFFKAQGNVDIGSVWLTGNTAGGTGDNTFGEDGTVSDFDQNLVIAASPVDGSTFGGPSDDQFGGGSEDDDFNGQGGDDRFDTGTGSDTVTTGSGLDVIQGELAELVGETVTDFATPDLLYFIGAIYSPNKVLFDTNGTRTIISIDTSTDVSVGSIIQTVTFEGDYTGGVFYTGHYLGGTMIGYSDFAPTFSEGSAILTDQEVNRGLAIVLSTYEVYELEIVTSDAFTDKENAVGYYFFENGTITGVTIVGDGNAKNGGAANISIVPDDAALIPFIIQDGFDFIQTLNPGDVLTMNSDGDLFVDGFEANVTIWHLEETLNSDGISHTRAGAVDNDTIRIGFEDMGSGGDRDFQDVIVEISIVE